jgi:hypothetical protein
MMTTQQFLRRVAVASAVVYVALVAAFVALKATTPRFGAVAWSEIVYGPAITVVCSFLLICAGARIECWFRNRTY